MVLALRGRTWLRAGMCYGQGCAALGPPEPEPSTEMQLSLRAIRSPIKVTRAEVNCFLNLLLISADVE